MFGRGGVTVGSRAQDAREAVGAGAIDATARAAETVQELAGRAVEVAAPALRSAAERAAEAAEAGRRAAAPVIRSAATSAAGTLSDAAERAAELLADTAERLQQQGGDAAGSAGLAARERLADASEAFAAAVRPRRRRRLRRAVVVVGIAGGAAAVWMSPLGARIKSAIGLGAAAEPTPEEPPITLPAADLTGTAPNQPADRGVGDAPETPAGAAEAPSLSSANGDGAVAAGLPSEQGS